MIKNPVTSVKNILFSSLLNDDYNIFLKNLFDYFSLINQKNELGETLLHMCCFYGMIDKYYALINMGAEIEKTSQNNNLLHYACFSGKDNFLIVELVKMEILPHETNLNGQTSLHLVANQQIAHYLKLWCERNNVIISELLDNDGNSVLHIAQKLGHSDVIEYWIKHYPELTQIKNKHGILWKDIETIPTALNNLTFINGEI